RRRTRVLLMSPLRAQADDRHALSTVFAMVHLVDRAHGHRDGQALGAAALIGAPSRWHIVIVATDGDFDVAVVGDQVVGWVESPPTMAGRERFDPGVRRVGPASWSGRITSTVDDDVPAGIPRRNVDRA